MSSISSELSRTVEVTVQTAPGVPGAGEPVKPADLNGDARVDLVDFSILIFWFRKPLSAEFQQLEKEFLNGDGKMEIVVFGEYYEGAFSSVYEISGNKAAKVLETGCGV